MSYSSALLYAFATPSVLIDRITSALNDQTDVPILEFAAATGIARDFSADKDKIILVENDPEVTAATKHYEPKEHVQYLVNSPWKVEKSDNSIGTIVLACNALYRLRPSSYCFSEAHRLLRPGGRLFIALDDFDELEGRTDVRVWRELHDTHVMERRLYKTPSGSILITRVSSMLSSTLHKYDFVWMIPPIARITHILRGMGFDVANPEPVDLRDDAYSDGRRMLLVEARKREDTPILGHTETRQIYDDIADEYDRFVGRSEYRVPDWLFGEVGEKYGTARRSWPHVVLDLGCGNGYLGRRLMEEKRINARFFGCDLSSQMVEQCRSRGGYEATLTFDLDNGVPIVESEVFDIAVACGFMEFLDSCEQLIEGIRRVLKPGGSALLTFQESREWDEENRALGAGDARRAKVRTYTVEDVEVLLVACRLSVRTMKTGIGYRSPTTGRDVSYIFVHAEKIQ